MLETTRSLLLKLLKERIQHLEAAITTIELLQNREASKVMRGYLQDLLVAYDDLLQIKGI